MAKPTLKYIAYQAKNPRTGATYTAVTLTDRPTKNTEQIAKELIASGHALGVKKSLLVGMLNSVADYVNEQIQEGYSILFNNRLSIRLDLTGPANEDGTLNAATNGVTVNAIPLDEAKKVTLDSFGFTNVKDAGETPHIDFVKSAAAGAVRGELAKSKPIGVDGVNLLMKDGDTATLSWPGEDDEPMSLTLTPAVNGPNYLQFAWPSTLDAVAVGTELTLTLRITDSTGSPKTSNAARAKVVAAA